MDKVTENCEKEDSLMMFGYSTPMVIKFEIPKANMEEGKRVCSVCKKEFSSGKALGGHMRVHVMYHKNGPFKTGSKLFKKIGDNEDFSGGAKGDEGLKVVGSKSSSLSCNSNVLGDYGGHVVDLTKYLKGGPVTERRGRRSLKMDDSDEDDEDLLEVAEDLMSLANGHWSSVIEGSNSNVNSPPSIDKGKAIMQVEDYESKEVQMELDDHESDSRNSDEKQLVII
nr:hypothetical protein [Tanacetum cinerariifolium]